MNPKNQNANKVITVENERDLIKMFAMPSGRQSRKARFAATQMVPVDKSLKPGEKDCIMDSGAGCNAADATKEFVARRVKSVKHKQQRVLADGIEITSRGICKVTAMIEGGEHLIPLEDLLIECPIISVRKVVKKGNIVKCKGGGGYIMNITTKKKKKKKKLRSFENNGVHFMASHISQ